MKRIIISLMAAVAVTISLTAQSMNPEAKLRYAEKLIERYYVDTINMDHVAEEAIIAMLKTLDPHSQYSNAEETRELTEPLQGNFSGIGIQFNLLNDTVYVVQPIVGGPCERVGIVAGDRIISAGDSIISGVKKKNSDIMKILRGPKGSKVRLKVIRRGVAEPIDFLVTRDDIPITSIDASYMAAPGVGYIKLSRFAENSGKEIEQEIKRLKKQGMKDIIIDLQYNGGGYLNAAKEIAEMLLNGGDLIVYTKGLNSPESRLTASGRKSLVDGKVVMLVNQYSASASEILSGAVQDHDRGVIVGRRTFGKGLVQRPFPFPDGSMIRLTIARYYTPSGRCIQKPYAEGEDDSYNRDIISRFESGELTGSDSIHTEGQPEYKTLRLGRTVYGGGGIMPDRFVAIDTTASNAYSRDLLAQGLYNTFCFNYIDSNRKQLKKTYPTEDQFIRSFEVSKSMLNDFRAYAAKEKVECDQESFDAVAPMIATIIKAFIGRDLFTQSTYFRVVNEKSDEYREALRIITDDNAYRSILSNER